MSFRLSLKPLLGLALGLLLAFPVLPQGSGRTLAVKPAQGEGKRIALVIGNDSYQRVDKLKNARADARAMAKALEDAGFKVTLRLDANEKAMKESMRLFKGQISKDDFDDAISTSPYSFDITAAHIQTTTDVMLKHGIGKMTAPPVAVDWVKTDLLVQAKKTLNVK